MKKSARWALGCDPGAVADVGALDSNSIGLTLKTGGNGFTFEPHPEKRSWLIVHCRDAKIDPWAVSEFNVQTASVLTRKVSSGTSTLLNFHASDQVFSTVEAVRLDTFLQLF